MLVLFALACGPVTSVVPTPPPTEPVPTEDTATSVDTGTIARCDPEDPGEPDVVVTAAGAFRGALDRGVRSWKGIPYAEPPVGPLRWADPLPAACEESVRPAMDFGTICPQWSDDEVPVPLGGEDCLTLNVWAPEDAEDLPVLVYIHGGGNVRGSASLERFGTTIFDGRDLAERADAVVVTLQYRLGVLGFLVLPDELATGVDGNLGLSDQILALDWVREEIGAFGGDPSRVLLFGESGGARDVCALLASPVASGRFQAAIMQSGACVVGEAADRASEGQAYLENTSCADAPDPLGCLRGLSADELIAASEDEVVNGIGLVVSPFGPGVDGRILPRQPLETFALGEQDPIPVVVGANAEETAVFLPATVSAEAYPTLVRAALGSTIGLAAANEALALYPLEDFDSARDALIALTSDAQFVCSARRAARALADHQTVYRYLFDHRLNGPIYGLAGAGHGVELPFVFQAMDRATPYTATEDDHLVEAVTLQHWGGLARDGVPGADWTAYDPVADTYLAIRPDPAMEQGLSTERCDFWDGLVAAP